MQKLAFALPTLGASQIAFNAIKTINWLGDHGVATLLFYEALEAPCMHLETGCMNLIDAYSWDGAIISTSLSIARKVLEYPGPRHKFFYMWDLDWMRLPAKEYSKLFRIYNDASHRLIARSESHARKFQQLWGRTPEFCLEDFDAAAIKSLLSS